MCSNKRGFSMQQYSVNQHLKKWGYEEMVTDHVLCSISSELVDLNVVCPSNLCPSNLSF